MRTSCPSGYSRSGSSCAKSQAASSNTTYSCPSGYSVVGSSCHKAPTLTCSVNHTLINGQCVHQYTLSPPALSCPSGYTTSRVNNSTICRSVKSTIPTCPGATRVGTGSQMYCTLAATASTSYSCPSGYTRSGTTCTAYAALIYSCDSGFARSGSGSSTQCTRVVISNQDATKQNSCPATYSIASSDCQREARIAAIQALSCSAGYTSEGSQCTKIVGGRTVTATPNVSTSCQAGFTQVGSGNSATCEKRERISSPRVDQQTCEDGWNKRIIGTTIDCVRTA